MHARSKPVGREFESPRRAGALLFFVDTLLGMRTDTMEVVDVSDGDFHIKMHICNKSDNFIWSLVVVYGPAREVAKTSFLLIW